MRLTADECAKRGRAGSGREEWLMVSRSFVRDFEYREAVEARFRPQPLVVSELQTSFFGLLVTPRGCDWF